MCPGQHYTYLPSSSKVIRLTHDNPFYFGSQLQTQFQDYPQTSITNVHEVCMYKSPPALCLSDSLPSSIDSIFGSINLKDTSKSTELLSLNKLTKDLPYVFVTVESNSMVWLQLYPFDPIPDSPPSSSSSTSSTTLYVLITLGFVVFVIILGVVMLSCNRVRKSRMSRSVIPTAASDNINSNSVLQNTFPTYQTVPLSSLMPSAPSTFASQHNNALPSTGSAFNACNPQSQSQSQALSSMIPASSNITDPECVSSCCPPLTGAPLSSPFTLNTLSDMQQFTNHTVAYHSYNTNSNVPAYLINKPASYQNQQIGSNITNNNNMNGMQNANANANVPPAHTMQSMVNTTIPGQLPVQMQTMIIK